MVFQDAPDGDVSSLELDYPKAGDASSFERGVKSEEDDIGEKVKVVVAVSSSAGVWCAHVYEWLELIGCVAASARGVTSPIPRDFGNGSCGFLEG